MKELIIKLTDDEEFVYKRAAEKRNMTLEELFKISLNEFIKKESISYIKEMEYIEIEKSDGSFEKITVEQILENYDI